MTRIVMPTFKAAAPIGARDSMQDAVDCHNALVSAWEKAPGDDVKGVIEFGGQMVRDRISRLHVEARAQRWVTS